MTALDDVAVSLRDVVDGLARHFGGTPNVLRDAAEDCDPTDPGRTTLWAYTVSVPAGPDSATVLHERVDALMTAAGWTASARDTEREFATRFSRDGYDLGVLVGRAPGADVVIGASSPCLPV